MKLRSKTSAFASAAYIFVAGIVVVPIGGYGGGVRIALLSFAVVLSVAFRKPQMKRRAEFFGASLCVLFIVLGAIGLMDQDFRRAPLAGGSDQIDYVSMAFAMAETGTIGTSAGPSVATPVVELGEKQTDATPLLERWEGLADRPDSSKPYAYRPLGYPIVLSAWFVAIGYAPDSYVLLNTGLLIGAMLAVFIAGWRRSGLVAGSVAAGVLLNAEIVSFWARQAMPETLSVFCAASLIALLTFLPQAKRLWTTALAAGSIALLSAVWVLVKQTNFFLVAMAILTAGGMMWFSSRSRPAAVSESMREVADDPAHSSIARRFLGVATVATAAALALVFQVSYFVGVTGDLSLPLGTSGSHDLPSVYSQEYLDGENRFEVREALFSEHAEKTGETIVGDVDRALAGREMFSEIIRDGSTWRRLPHLVWFKVTNSLKGSYNDGELRLWLFAALCGGLFGRAASRRESTLTPLGNGIDSALPVAFVLAVALLPLAVVAATFHDSGRLISVTWVAVALAPSVLSVNRAPMGPEEERAHGAVRP